MNKAFKSRVLLAILTIIVIFSTMLLVSCVSTPEEPASTSCAHDYSDATCTVAKTCKRCGETEGEALGHDYSEATCTTSKICARCGEADGDKLGHDYENATCTAAKTCKKCGVTEGKALGHNYTTNTQIGRAHV